MVKKHIIPRGVRLNADGPKNLMNTLAGTYAPLGSVSIKGTRLTALIRTESLMNMISWSLTSRAIMTSFSVEISYERLE